MKSSKLCLTALISSQMLLGSMAHADQYQDANGGPEETIVSMGLDYLKSIGGDKLKELLFPSQTIDYDRIKKDMEEVTRQQIVNAEIDKVMGRISGAAQNARTDVLDNDPVPLLISTRKDLVTDISELTGEEFKYPAIGNYVQGAQTEVSILAAMLEASPAPVPGSNACDRACVIATFKERLKTHVEYVTTTTNTVLTTLVDNSAKSIGGCYPDDEIISDWQGRPHIIHHGYMFEDPARGYASGHSPERSTCDGIRDNYVQNIKNNERVIQSGKLAWIYKVRASWTAGLVALNPSISQADKNALITQAVKDVAPVYLASNSACYNQLYLAVKDAPNSCQTMKEASDYYIQVGTCTKEVSDLYTMVGCK